MPSWFRWLVIGGLLLGALWMAGRLYDVMLLLAIALLLTATLLSPVRWLEARGVPHLAAVTLCFSTILALLGGFLAYLIPVMVDQVSQLALALPGLEDRWSTFEQRWTGWRGRFPFLPRLSEVLAQITENATEWVQQSLSYTGRLLAMTIETATVLFLVFFFLKDGSLLLRQVLSIIPPPARKAIPPLLEGIGTGVGNYVLGRIVVSLVLALLVMAGLMAVGMPYAVVLGVLVGVLDIIPYLGPLLSAAPGVLIAVSHSWETTFWVVLIYFVAQQIEAYVLSPFIVGKSVGLHPAWVVLALLVGAELMGVMGMILAVPVAVALHVLLEALYLPWLNRRHAAESPPDEAPTG